MLGYSPATGTFENHRDNPLRADAVIVDEASMVDSLLMCHLVQAISMQARLILVGDVFQLPSVGPGSVLSDLIRSERLPTFELTRIFRQDRESQIVRNAHRIRQGELPVADSQTQEHTDFYFIEQPNPVRIVKTIVKLCAEQIPKRYGLDSKRDIQVITPMHRGRTGTIHLNEVLQKELNLNEQTENRAHGSFIIEDKVMHLKNNYEKDVFNGDIGTIQSIAEDMYTLDVEYEGRTVSYDFSELDELALAYAISVHKSQGSEYPAVIIPLTTQHYPLLQRNLLYTAITRGKELVILIGTRKSVSIALKNDKPQKRLTGLTHRLAAFRF
jgi:exodeoxyribonuclease V alpha subunit